MVSLVIIIIILDYDFSTGFNWSIWTVVIVKYMYLYQSTMLNAIQVILSSVQNGAFLENAIPLFLKVLKDEKPFFIAEKAQQVSI